VDGSVDADESKGENWYIDGVLSCIVNIIVFPSSLFLPDGPYLALGVGNRCVGTLFITKPSILMIENSHNKLNQRAW
jgi:hypothetical protein